MSGETLRVVSTNTHCGDVLSDKPSMEKLLPDTDLQSVVAFQEVRGSRQQEAVEAVSDRGWTAMPAQEGTALMFAVKGVRVVEESEKVFFPRLSRLTRWRSADEYRLDGLHAIRVQLQNGQTCLVVNGQFPVYFSPARIVAGLQERKAITAIATSNDDAMAYAVDMNSMFQGQVERYKNRQQKTWGGAPLFDGQVTYPINRSPYRMAGNWLIRATGQPMAQTPESPDAGFQLDEIFVDSSNHQHINEVTTIEVNSDHLALSVIFQLPSKLTEQNELPDTPSDALADIGRMVRARYRVQKMGYAALNLDHLLKDHPNFERLPKPMKWVIERGMATFFDGVRKQAGG